jgi:hypothetical protein
MIASFFRNLSALDFFGNIILLQSFPNTWISVVYFRTFIIVFIYLFIYTDTYIHMPSLSAIHINGCWDFISWDFLLPAKSQTFNKVPYQTLISPNCNWFCFNSIALFLLSYISIKISLISFADFFVPIIYNFLLQFLYAKMSPFIININFTTCRAKFISYRWSV